MRAALGFLTPLPVGSAAPDRRTLAWFPVAGMLVGLLVGTAWWAATEVFPIGVAAAIAIAVDLVLTGALHVDGLADSADGLLPPLADRERRFAVMRRPDVGAFGAAAVGAVLLLRWSALAAMRPDAPLLGALWAMSRSAMAVGLLAVPYVGAGLGSAFLGAARTPVAVASVLAVAAPVALTDDPAAAAIAVLVGVGAGAAVVMLGRRRLGGITGDVAGAAGLLAETVGLVVASARW